MGLLSKEDIANEKFNLMEWNDILKAYTIKKTFSINDIISLNGERIPTPATSQKKFKVAFILITDKEGATTEEIETLKIATRAFEEWFYEATDDRATIDFSIN